ncbi:serine/threonine protein kinase [Streptomyces cyaneochromogenes]|uniref:Serine/threonine protein kinase n=1 Tax=Streptomyces cyaneochromogenes TaxID=2496836 RepID=A0A3Q9EWU0_9ACTN|nr:serine/threonine-protein kinase [Streptomyces cyaneochromogenes]AZQ40587.1 serine/threonine protein kinase [Streptomyces cyaneochromogenes]
MEKPGAGDPTGIPPGVGHRGRIGAYRLLARLGAGGMGEVYLARSDRGRTVAVKLVRRELAAQEEFRARFRQEVRAAQRVGGFWTAPVLDADTEAEVPWVATGYVAGPSLQQVVGRDHGALPERSVRILAAGLAHALQDIHAAGIVHRDLKPSNVLVTIDGPRVIDFGIARALETVDESGLTRTGALVGSPGFMAPEQVRGDRITPACDVFCLGSILAYACTGNLPFGSVDSGAHAVMFRIAQEEPDLDGVPEGIAELVRDCLRKDPGARPTLERILARTGAEDTVSDGRSRDPWLPSALVAQLGRHAVRLLDAEDPVGPGPGQGQGGAGAPEAGSVEPTPAASPEHAPAAGATPPDQLPTIAATQNGRTSPQQHPQQPAYGYPPAPPAGPPAPYGPSPSYGPNSPYGPAPSFGPNPSFGPSPSYGPTPPYDPPRPYDPTPPYLTTTPPEPPHRSGRSTLALVLVALVVALAAGGSVYALMSGGGDDRAGGDPTTTPTVTTTTTGDPTGPSPLPTPTPTPSKPPDGVIPADYLGTWTASIDNAAGENTRRLTIRQGEVGDTVLSLVADGPAGTGTYHCEFEAPLAEAPGDEGPVAIGPSTVTAGEPATACSPGEATEITLLPDGRLERVNPSSGEKLTYTRR